MCVKYISADPTAVSTDGRITDMQKVMLSAWVMEPLHSSWQKPADAPRVLPIPDDPDSDGDGWDDGVDPYPLFPYDPVIPPGRAVIDGEVDDWAGHPTAGECTAGEFSLKFRHAYDPAGYYGVIEMEGDWRSVTANFDGEGKGIYSGEGVQGLSFVMRGGQITVNDGQFKAPGHTVAWSVSGDKAVLEFKFPNKSGKWFWEGGGREIGWTIHIEGVPGDRYSVAEPFQLIYSKMLEPVGERQMPPGGSTEITADESTVVLPGGEIDLQGGWKVVGDHWEHSGDESAMVIAAEGTHDFDLWVDIEAKTDVLLGAFQASTEALTSGVDYITFCGGYTNTRSKMRLFGRETGESDTMLTGRHWVQFSRRDGELWVLFDGEPILWAVDPKPEVLLNRLAVLGGFGGAQKVYEIRYRSN